MTGRVCPVHGEYSETGVCRWCEPSGPDKSAILLPVTRCRCGWMAWTEYARKPFREEYNGMIHSPEQCYATAATPPAEPVSLPGLKGLWQKPDRIEVNEAGVPTYTFTLTEKTLDAYRWRLEWHDVKEPEEYDYSRRHQYRQELLAQHAALRWERVARRWNYKHAGSITAVYLDWQRAIDEMAERLRRMFALPEDPPP